MVNTLDLNLSNNTLQKSEQQIEIIDNDADEDLDSQSQQLQQQLQQSEQLIDADKKSRINGKNIMHVPEKETNQLSIEFNDFWETMQLVDDMDDGIRFFDHSCTVTELQEKYRFDGEDGLSRNQAAKNQQILENYRIQQDSSQLHQWRLHRYMLHYRYCLGVAAMIFFAAFIVTNTDLQNLFISIMLMVSLVFIGCFKHEPRGRDDWNRIQCEVIRDGKEMKLPAVSVVVGDMLELKEGKRLPVDVRVVAIKIHSKTKEKVLKSNIGCFGAKNSSERILSTVCTNPINWRQSANIVLQGQEITYGQGLGIAISNFRESMLQKTVDKYAGIRSDAQISVCGGKPKRFSIGSEIRQYATMSSVLGFIFSGVLGLVEFFWNQQNVIMSLITAGWVLIAFLPFGLAAQVSIARWVSRRNQAVTTEYVEIISEQPCFCADLSILGSVKVARVKNVWINGKIETVESLLCLDDLGQLMNGFLELHTCFMATREMSTKEVSDKVSGRDLDDVMSQFFLKLPSTQFVKQTVSAVQNIAECQAAVPPHESLSFAMKVIKQETAVGELVAYIRGDPLKILEVCKTFLVDGEEEITIDEEIRNRIENVMREFNDMPKKRVVAFARKELANQASEQSIYIEDFFVNKWGKTNFSFSGFQLIALVDFELETHVTATFPSLSFIKTVFFSDFDKELTYGIMKDTGMVTQEIKKQKQKIAISHAANVNRRRRRRRRMNSSHMNLTGESARQVDGELLAAAQSPAAEVEQQQQSQQLYNNVITPDMLSDFDKGLDDYLANSMVVFSGLNEQQKIRVVKRLRELENSVCYLVNELAQVAIASAADVSLSTKEFGNSGFVDYFLNDNISEFLSIIETSISLSLQETENIRKIFAYFAAISSAKIMAVIIYFVFQLPYPISGFQMLILTSILNALPAISLVFEVDNSPLVVNRQTRKHAMGKFRVVTGRLVVYAHVVLGCFTTAAGMVCYFWSMANHGFSVISLFGITRRQVVQPNYNYLRPYVLSLDDLTKQRYMSPSYDFPIVGDAGVIVTPDTPYWSPQYMKKGQTCMEDAAFFKFEQNQIDWTSDEWRYINLRKRMNVCDEKTGKWLTAQPWGYCNTNQLMTTSAERNENICYTIESMRSAQTAYMSGVILCSIGVLFAVKSLRQSSFLSSFNWQMIVAVLIQIGLGVLITSVDSITQLTGQHSVPVLLWGFPAAIFAVLVLVHEEFRKAVLSQSKWLKAVTDF